MKQRLKWISITVVVVLVVVVVLQNTATVDTKLLFVTLSMPRAALLFGTLVVGFVLGVVMERWRRSRKAEKKRSQPPTG